MISPGGRRCCRRKRGRKDKNVVPASEAVLDAATQPLVNIAALPAKCCPCTQKSVFPFMSGDFVN